MPASSPCPQHALRARLLACLQADDIDGAIDAGLLEFVPCAGDCCGDTAPLLAAQSRLRSAWAARDRYRSRQARLQRRAAERDARRAVIAGNPAAGMPEDPASPPAPLRPALPASAAAILARAKAKAAGRPLD